MRKAVAVSETCTDPVQIRGNILARLTFPAVSGGILATRLIKGLDPRMAESILAQLCFGEKLVEKVGAYYWLRR